MLSLEKGKVGNHLKATANILTAYKGLRQKKEERESLSRAARTQV